MLRMHRRDLGVLIVLLGFLVSIASVPVAHAYSQSGGGTGQVPTDPQFGAGGGGPGGNGTADPDEYGIYTRIVPSTPPVVSAPSAPADASVASAPTKIDLRLQAWVFFYQLLGGVIR